MDGDFSQLTCFRTEGDGFGEDYQMIELCFRGVDFSILEFSFSGEG